MAIILVRHGPTSFNIEQGQSASHERVRGWSDPPLSEDGLQIAQDAAQHVSQYPIEHVYSSDFQRAAVTAQAIAQASGRDHTTHPELRSWNLGDLSGKPVKEVDRFIERLGENPDQPAPNGESMGDAINRVLSFLVPLAQKDGLYAAVTHGRPQMWLKAYYDGGGQLDLESIRHAEWEDPGEAVYFGPQLGPESSKAFKTGQGYQSLNTLNPQDRKLVHGGDTGKDHF